ncbi:MAG: TetR/AcrR family transcriptional regulator [Roseibacillus sp.]
MNATAKKIVDCAERLIRDGGYHSFSFRQIASELGIKSASIHYHFPSKELLGVAVAQRYTHDFLESLGEPTASKGGVSRYIEAFQSSLRIHKRACLCGILAAESGRLPESIRETLESFSQENLNWLEQAISSEYEDWAPQKVENMAAVIFSALEGAITFSAMINQPSHLKQVGDSLLEMVG